MPVLFTCRNGDVVGAAHAGWRGLSGGVLENTVRGMIALSPGLAPQDICAWMGPAIGPTAFEVGEDVRHAFAGQGQHQDAGAKMIHFAPNTTSRIVSKSISKEGGRSSYRGLIQVMPQAKNSAVYVSCDALLLDEASRSDTYPTMRIKNNESTIQHEATVEKIGEEKLLYLMSRGLSKIDAETAFVNGFIEPVVKEIPLEYSVELNRLIRLEMEGSVG